jgi:hypothetical protein
MFIHSNIFFAREMYMLIPSHEIVFLAKRVGYPRRQYYYSRATLGIALVIKSSEL